MTDSIPVFGLVEEEAEFHLRPGGYAVIFRVPGEIAVVRAPMGFALPGGGQHEGEAPEQAAIRETREECGLRIELTGLLGMADELVFAADENLHYRKRCTFFLARIVGTGKAEESDHELVWLAPQTAFDRLRHASQRWAIRRALEID
ncbi:MAG: NUDIX domain-containing protein [Blastocatellia bacterium]|nr:NUDIX domain-containing protein [Blastocatellia bacterium]